MAALPSLLDFALPFGEWSLLCLAVYASLRWFGRRFPRALCALGSTALMGWLLLFDKYYPFLSSGDPPANSVVAALGLINEMATGLGKGRILVLLATLAGGGALVHRATQKQFIWWHSVLFTAFYYSLVQFAVSYLMITHREIPALLFEIQLWPPVNLPSQVSSYIGLFLLLFFSFYPLAMPLFELLIRSLYRAYQQTKSGSFA